MSRVKGVPPFKVVYESKVKSVVRGHCVYMPLRNSTVRKKQFTVHEPTVRQRKHTINTQLEYTKTPNTNFLQQMYQLGV